ncbi:ribosome biogenesis protein BMS1 homolog [Macaca mulatta]
MPGREIPKLLQFSLLCRWLDPFTGKKCRLTIIECGCDINMMIDLAKAADLGAKLFCLSGMVHGEYQNQEMHNLGRFITVMKFRPLTWQTSHPYILADRMEDLTNPEDI